jgi:excisionase family DNA binding protein
MVHGNRPLVTKEAASYLRLSVSKLEKMRCDGTGPVFIKAGKAVRYELSALDEWLAARRRTSTADRIADLAAA